MVTIAEDFNNMSQQVYKMVEEDKNWKKYEKQNCVIKSIFPLE